MAAPIDIACRRETPIERRADVVDLPTVADYGFGARFQAEALPAGVRRAAVQRGAARPFGLALLPQLSRP
jgi:hypothetical protein